MRELITRDVVEEEMKELILSNEWETPHPFMGGMKADNTFKYFNILNKIW